MRPHQGSVEGKENLLVIKYILLEQSVVLPARNIISCVPLSEVAFRCLEAVTAVIQNMHSLEATEINYMLRCKFRCLHMYKPLHSGNPPVFSDLW